MKQQQAVFGSLLPSYTTQHTPGSARGSMASTDQMDESSRERKRSKPDGTRLSPSPPNPQPRQAHQRAPKGKGKGKGKSNQGGPGQDDTKQVLKLLASVSLQQADQLARLQMETGFLLTLKNDDSQECLLPVLWKVSARWKQTWEDKPTDLKQSLRATLMTCLLTELLSRIKGVAAKPEVAEECKKLGWLSPDGDWVYQHWDPQVEQLRLDAERKPVSTASFIEQVQQAMLLIVVPDKLTRFQAARKFVAEMRGPTVAFLIDVGMRTRADALHELFHQWVDLSVWNLVAGRLRPQRLRRPPAVEKLSSWLAAS